MIQNFTAFADGVATVKIKTKKNFIGREIMTSSLSYIHMCERSVRVNNL